MGSGAVGERESKAMVSPWTTEGVATVARYANENRLAIEIVGAGTKRGWGNPVDADILLETAGLVGVREHSWQDLTATVGAGTTWAAMQKALAVHGQRVALDPLWPETATVGGIIATNDSGALRLKYGSLRDLIIGMTIVLADGTVAKSGGKVVKNVAGYDLHKLMTGAFGTLGVIADVTFRLHPLPAETRTWTISSSSSEPMGELMMEVLDSQLSTQAMQLRAGAEGYLLDVELAALPEVLALQVEALDRLAQGGNGTGGDVGTSSVSPFEVRERLFDAPGGVVVKATMLPSAIARLSADVVRLGGTAATQATGIMFARFEEETARTALPFLQERVAAAGDGSLTVLRAPVGLLPTRDEKISLLMLAIKQRFDANGVLNPGRMGGGI